MKCQRCGKKGAKRRRQGSAYVDDEKAVIDDTVNTFSQSDATLPVLCRIERDGIKDPGYTAPESHKGIGNITVVQSLMDNDLLKALYAEE